MALKILALPFLIVILFAGVFTYNNQQLGATIRTMPALYYDNTSIVPRDDTWDIKIPALPNCDTIDTDADGLFSCGTDDGGSGFATTTADYWGSQRADTAIDWSASGFALDATGDWTGTLDTYEASDLIFTTTTVDYWETTQSARGGFATTTNDYWGSQRAGTAIDWSSGFDLDATGNWTGTFDGWEGTLLFNTTSTQMSNDDFGDFSCDGTDAGCSLDTDYLTLSDWFSTTTQISITSIPTLDITESQISDFGDYLDESDYFASTTPTHITSLPSSSYVANAWDALTDMTLTDNYIYVGDVSNNPVSVAMSNDCTIASDGNITCDHDALDNFVANEHLDWTSDLGATNIHSGNYTDTNTTYTATNPLILTDTVFSIASASTTLWETDNDTTYVSSDFTHDDLTGFVANEHLDWTSDLGAVNIHAGNYTSLTNLTDFDQTAWRLFYSNNLGDVIELSLGTDGQYLKSQGGTSSLTWGIPTNTTYTAGNGMSMASEVFSVAGNTALTQDADGLSITADGVGDTQLAFNTGQHLTSTSIPTFGEIDITHGIRSATSTFTGMITASGGLTGNITGNCSGSSGSCTGNAATATALASNPTDCGALQYATTIAANGNLTCSFVNPSSITETTSLVWSGLISDETGTGLAVFGTSPTFLTGITVPDNSISAAELNEGDAFAWTAAHTFSGGGDINLPDDSVDATDINTINCGRSMTWDATNDEIDADAELYTDEKGVYIENPVVESLNDLFWLMNDVTITYVWCMTDTGTVTLNLEDGSDNNILSAELVCDVGGQTSCASGCDVNTINGTYDNITAKTENIDYDCSAVASSPTKVSVFIGYTIDD